MRTESNIRPEAAEIEIAANGIAEVILRENITEETREDATMYRYDEYRMTVPYRDNLLENVQKTLNAWMTSARNAEYARLAAEVRAKRDALLAATERYFDADTAEALLDSVYAQDVDGFLCVSKSLGLGGPGYDVTLTVTDSGDGSYTIRMDSVLAGDDLQFDPVSVQYRPANGTAIFGGDYDTIQSFFITCLYINECTVVFE